MGFFATYCGIIYNDFMAIPIWAFDSCYDVIEVHTTHNETDHKEGHHTPLEAIPKEDCVYPVGVDPVWYMGTNELGFLNSLKMKLSVILGVLQMSLGIVMKAFNAAYFKNKIDFFFEFVP
jgi:V-type H+-transporting ATPase subunit a